MTPEKQEQMRQKVADYSRQELTDLAIGLQKVVDEGVARSRGLQSSNDALARQVEVLQGELDKYDGATQADPEETKELEEQNAALLDRVNALRELNEKLQAKLLA